MAIKKLLVHLDHSSGCKNRLETGFELAKRFDAQLSGIFVVPDYIIPAYVEAQISVDLMADITEKAIARAKDQIVTYQALADEAGVAMEAQVVEGQLTPILREYSKYSDLLLLGQDQPDDPDNTSYALADDLLLEGACACLVIPHSGKISPPGKRILVAWNASRESARAVREAMPFLTRAEQVVVLSAEPDRNKRDDEHAREIARYLSAHGIDPVAGGISGMDMRPADAIMAQAADMNADLIVMGAYGHMRLREFILGGATRDMLKQAPVSLLMAH
jgi:nucleotide-binding universal stress UspA family protein